MIFLKILYLVIFCALYALGGQGFKWSRKWVGPSVLCLSLILTAIFSGKIGVLVFLGSALYLAAANGFSYGETFTKGQTDLKILFRGLCGASYGLCGLIVGIGTGHWVFGIIQLLLATAGSIGLGVLNPFSKLGNDGVMLEDICIAICSVGLVPFII